MLFYDDSLEIGLPQLERIVQSILLLGDCVLLPSFAYVPSSIQDRFRKLIEEKIISLVDERFILPWTLPRAIEPSSQCIANQVAQKYIKQIPWDAYQKNIWSSQLCFKFQV